MVSDVSFSIARGQALGLVGESGCGKSSLGLAVMQLPRPESGRILFNGRDLTRMDKKSLNRIRPKFQMIFQDSAAALNPCRTVLDTVVAPLKAIGQKSREKNDSCARQMLVSVGMDPELGNLLPHELSGGQCQRVQIARALIAGPDLLICDEPVSSLDVSVQAQIINLLENLRQERGLTLLFISHDLAVVKNICDRVAVMYLGRLCEEAASQVLYQRPWHPYTKSLLNAIPRPDPEHLPNSMGLPPGEIPSPGNPPSGCRFRTRCPRAGQRCAVKVPQMREIEPGHKVACHFPML